MHKKRLFVILMSASLLVLAGFVIGGTYLLLNNGSTMSQILLWGLSLLAVSIFLILGFGIAFLIFSLWRQKTTPTLQNLIQAAVNMLFPFALGLGKLFGIDQEQIKSSFISVNNQLVRLRAIKVKPQEIMILAPHCLQRTKCRHKITVDTDNCRRCGKCTIDQLLRIRDNYGVNLAVATGGTLARSFVKKYRPRAIVAIACERDLTSGIQDTNNLPVLGVVNIRPEGPCFNTSVNLAAVEEAINSFLDQDRGKTKTSVSEQPLLGK